MFIQHAIIIIDGRCLMLTQLNNLKDQLDILRGEFFNLFVCLFNFC